MIHYSLFIFLKLNANLIQIMETKDLVKIHVKFKKSLHSVHTIKFTITMIYIKFIFLYFQHWINKYRIKNNSLNSSKLYLLLSQTLS